MKNKMIFAGVFLVTTALFSGCAKEDAAAPAVVSDFTGNQTTYALAAASAYPISGTVVFKERKDGTTTIAVSLTGITDSDQHPVHLHLGDLSVANAPVAALLNPVAGKDGQSSTAISQLGDDSKVSYSDLIKVAACVKIHLGDQGDAANVILAAGNIGSAASKDSNGRLGVSVCASVK